jgi:hypothetical protein
MHLYSTSNSSNDSRNNSNDSRSAATTVTAIAGTMLTTTAMEVIGWRNSRRNPSTFPNAANVHEGIKRTVIYKTHPR